MDECENGMDKYGKMFSNLMAAGRKHKSPVKPPARGLLEALAAYACFYFFAFSVVMYCLICSSASRRPVLMSFVFFSMFAYSAFSKLSAFE